MRVIVYGVGAVGGVVAAALVHAGHEVVGIARGAMLDALRETDLRLRAPGHDLTVSLPCVADPGEIAFRSDDVILLTMKTQDTARALDRLRAAGVTEQALFCLQNGVANERMALRRFANVHGVTVMMPAGYLTPGEVCAYHEPSFGLFDIGRYPAGSDSADESLAAILGRSNMPSVVTDDVMASKYGKLLMNLTNVVQAALGGGQDQGRIPAALRAEAETVLTAAGIAWRDVDQSDPRRADLLRPGEVKGVTRIGGSTTQSLARGTGHVETDYLNGEIVLLGRLYDVPTPVNARAQAMGAELAGQGAAPGSMMLAEVEARLLDFR